MLSFIKPLPLKHQLSVARKLLTNMRYKLTERKYRHFSQERVSQAKHQTYVHTVHIGTRVTILIDKQESGTQAQKSRYFVKTQ